MKLSNIFNKHSKGSKNLLIVGNGFDLRSGLNSTFSNFFGRVFKNSLSNYTNKELFNINKYSHEYLYLKTNTITEILSLVNNGYSKLASIIDLKDDSQLKDYLYNLISMFMSYHYQLLGGEKDSKNHRILNDEFYKSSLFNLLIYVYIFKQFSYLKAKRYLFNFDDKNPDLIKCFNLLFINNKGTKQHKSHKNFWILYFEFMLSLESLHYYNEKKLITWSDIEKHLTIFLINYSKHIYEYLYYVRKFMKSLSNSNNIRSNTIKLSKKLYTKFYIYNPKNNGNNKFFELNIFTIFLILCGIYNCKSIKWSIYYNDKSYYYKFLYNQLYRFENLFSGYIKRLLYNSNKKRDDNSYNSIAPEIINKILPYHKHPFNLISFNYVPINKNIINKYDGNDLIKGNNIHSTIRSKEHPNGHPVFGISKYYCKQGNDIEPYIIFSKSYRVKDSKRNLALPKNVNNIIFFGHSFGSVDYPYFQWIFNKYSICTSNIKLIFCYSVHDNHGNNLIVGDKEYLNCKGNCFESQCESVKKLISKYSKNKSYKNNLYSKLFKEGRIIYHCIDDKYHKKI